MTPISATVVEFVDDKAYTEYIIEVRCPPESPPQRVNHRFSEFLGLHQKLHISSPFPCAKRLFHPRSAKVGRTTKLNAWIQGVARDYASDGMLRSFLNAPPLPLAEKPAAAASAPLASDTPASKEAVAFSTGAVVGIHTMEEWHAAVAMTEAGKLAMVVDFTAVWCGPCQKIAPKYAEYAKTHTGTLCVKVDVDELEEVAEQCEVTAMPTFCRFESATLVSTVKGINEAEIEALISKG